jgi:hypothetical protein
LGFDPDYLMYTSKEIRQWREKFFQGEDAKRFRFYWYYAERALMKHPARALAKVWRQMRLFYSARNPAFATSREIALTEPYRSTVEILQNPTFRSTFLRFPPSKKYEAACASAASAHWAVSQPQRIRRCNKMLQQVYLPVFCAILLASGLLLCSEKLRFAFGMLWPATLLIYSYNFGTCLETAIIHSLDNPRYMTVQFSFTLLAVFVGIYFLMNPKPIVSAKPPMAKLM